MFVLDVFRYFGEVAISGDYLNPFLYILPDGLMESAEILGKAISDFLY